MLVRFAHRTSIAIALAIFGALLLTTPAPAFDSGPDSDTDFSWSGNGTGLLAGLVSWADVEAGSGRLPTVTINDSIYPQVGGKGDRTGVQFFINGDADDRNSRVRPDGWDATGPQEGSNFHVYPKISLSVGDVIQARWVTADGYSHVAELVVGGGTADDVEPVAAQPESESDTDFSWNGNSSGLLAGLVSWADVDAGSKRLPTVTIDDLIYPQVGGKGDRTGVQFFINGDADDRNSRVRPDGWDATGPQEGSIFHVYPRISLSVGDVIQARWVTADGYSHVAELVVGGGTTDDVEPVAPTPTPTSEPISVAEPVAPTPTPTSEPISVAEPVAPTPTSEPVASQPTPSSEPVAPQPTPASVPVSGDFPSAATTGLSDASVLRPSGTVIVTTPGAVIENLDVTGIIVVKADNVTIRNVRVRKSVGASYGISTGFGEYTGTVIEHVELDGQRDVSGNSGSIGVCCSNYTLRYANIYGFRISATMLGNNVVESSWMHDHWGANGSHGEAIQSTGGSNMIVRNNNLDITGSSGATGALALFGNTSPITNVLVERNLFYGGGYCAYGGSSPEKPYPVATNIRFIDNHFRTTPGTYETCGRFGPVTAFNRSYEGNVWQGNVWHETGQPLP